MLLFINYIIRQEEIIRESIQHKNLEKEKKEKLLAKNDNESISLDSINLVDKETKSNTLISGRTSIKSSISSSISSSLSCSLSSDTEIKLNSSDEIGGTITIPKFNNLFFENLYSKNSTYRQNSYNHKLTENLLNVTHTKFNNFLILSLQL